MMSMTVSWVAYIKDMEKKKKGPGAYISSRHGTPVGASP